MAAAQRVGGLVNQQQSVFRPGYGAGSACAGGHFESDTKRAFEFQQAADAAVEQAAAVFHRMPPFFAICFNYRHALELQLKEIIRDADKAIWLLGACGSLTAKQERAVAGLPRRALTRIHGLRELLDHVVPRLRVLGADDLSASVRQLVDEFDDLDPKGQTFRYAHDQEGAASMPTQRHFDLARVRDAVADAMRELGRAQNWACITAQQCSEYLDSV